MDRLIHNLYTKNIIQIKKTELKNGLIVPFYIDLFKIFDDSVILEVFLSEFNNFIINNNVNFGSIFGKNDLCKNICTLLSYKYNYTNIIRENLQGYKSCDNSGNEKIINCLFIKENMGLSSKTTKYINRLSSYNINMQETISLINYNTGKTNDKSLYFLDSYKILQVLYKKEILDYDKFINILTYLSNNTYLNFEERLKNTNKNMKTIFNPLIEDM